MPFSSSVRSGVLAELLIGGSDSGDEVLTFSRESLHFDESLRANMKNNSEQAEEEQTLKEDKDLRTSEDVSEGAEKTRLFIQTLVEKIGYDCSVSLIACDKKHFSYRINSKDAAMLIGKKGKNLDSIQLLANVYAGTIGHAYARVSVDCESYRIRREELLIRMAYDVADKVRMTKKSFGLQHENGRLDHAEILPGCPVVCRRPLVQHDRGHIRFHGR